MLFFVPRALGPQISSELSDEFPMDVVKYKSFVCIILIISYFIIIIFLWVSFFFIFIPYSLFAISI